MGKSKIIIASGIAALIALLVSWRTPTDLEQKVKEYLASSAKNPDPLLVADLRKDGYQSLDWLYRTYWKSELNYESYRKERKFLELYDQVAGQKDAIASKLFWYTDFNQALEIAKKEDKPVLCLQMLGDLREDFSCANSRFFRTLLYSNEDVSRVLREKYVLCWEPVIRVPKVIIEYPDGKKQVQTITGNSMHMVFDKDGKILDALPGLYGPGAFLNWLTQLSLPDTRDNIKRIQKGRLMRLQDEKLKECVNDEVWNELVTEANPYQKSPEKAIMASEKSVAKYSVEAPLYTSVFTWNKKRFKKLPDQDQENFKYSRFGYIWEKLPVGNTTTYCCKKNVLCRRTFCHPARSFK